uniref:C2H2-type domain-containing protein n=1 Tax=Meloidogyne enterolobii TaxID=390850 RepID=A0A6V7VYU3_MELEN|nr:unnamed protein product [Meloidogyne enterolobii]
MDQFHSNLLLLQCSRLKTPPQPFDCAIRVFASDEFGSESKEHLIFVHSNIISTKSIILRSQLDSQPTIALARFLLLLHAREEGAIQGLATNGALNNELREIKLDLSALQNGLEAFKQFINFLYGDQSAAIGGSVSDQLLLLSKLFAVPDLEMSIRSSTILDLLKVNIGGQSLESQLPCNTTQGSSGINNSSNGISLPEQLANIGGFVNNNNNASPFNSLPLYAAYLQMQQSLLFTNQSSNNTTFLQNPQPASITQLEQPRKPTFATMFRDKHRSDSDNDIIIGEDLQQHNNQQLLDSQNPLMARRESNASSGSSSIHSSIGNENNSAIAMGESGGGGELLLPPNDKEGWCRNKKYIQIVKMGYRCLLCNKVYGRYNSVSYHVTIYHRNPPIRCEEQGCQFTTREARYIHFHKYYRHQIALPESIDLASRKCPLLGCKHVSKSPAMLEKHMQRHVADCLKEGGSSSIYICRMPVINGSITTKEDENMDSMENNDPEINKTLNMVKSMKERRNTYSGGCSGSSGGGQCLFKANSRELMYAHLLTCHSASSASTTTLSADAEKRGVEEDEDDETRSLAGGKMSASAPSTPPTSSQLLSPLLSRFPCNECNFRGRTLTSLTNHKLQKHSNNNKQQINGTTTSKPPHLPPTKCSSFVLPFNPSLFNCGTGGGIFGGSGGGGGFSVPGSPLSPQTGSLGHGNSSIYPTGLPPSFFNAPPTTSTTNLKSLGGLINDQQQTNNAHQLLAQLLAAQKLASAILSAAATTTNSSPPSSTSPATSSSSSPPISTVTQQQQQQ